MLQVLQNLSNGQTTLVEVPAPAPTSNRLVIQSRRTLISAGTEKMLVEFGQASWIGKAKAQPEKVKQVLDKIRTDGLLPTLEAVFSKLGEPLPLGYCNAGVVTDVGSHVTGFEVGDRVTSNGAHAELVSVPPLLCAKIPECVNDDEAAFTVLGSIGLQGVRLAEPTLGETAVVYGLGLIGLITVQLLRASGCHVIGIDINHARLKLAEEFGADVIHGAECADVVAKVTSLTRMRGADAVLITASTKSDAIISQSAKMCRRRGRIVLIGVVGLNISRSDFYEKEISFRVSCSYGPGRYDSNYEQKGNDYPIGFVRWTEQRNFEAILGLLASGQISFAKLISHHFEHAHAPNAYATIQRDSTALGVLLTYPESRNAARTISVSTPSQSKKEDAVIGAIVGAGNFSRATLLPSIRGLPLTIKYVVGRSGGAAVQHLASKFGIPNATTDCDAVLHDNEVNCVLITTNHDSHARLVCQAIEAGKHVFVEKPLALNVDDLNRIRSATEARPDLQLAVGFNRRFSPHVVKCRELLKGRVAPLSINILVNAGEIPSQHWVHDALVGGGRIVGEACHFIDLVNNLCGSLVRSVTAQRMGGATQIRDDKMSISLAMEDGSVASVNYFANGSKSFPKETITIFSDNRVLQIENFRRTVGFDLKGFSKFKTARQEKGHKQQFAALSQTLVNGGEWLIPMSELTNVTLASFAAVESATSEKTVQIRDESRVARSEEI